MTDAQQDRYGALGSEQLVNVLSAGFVLSSIGKGHQVQHVNAVLGDFLAQRTLDGARHLHLRSDRKVYVAANGLTIEPSTADRLVLGSVTLAIVSVKKLSPAGTTVYFELQCRV